MSPNVGEKSNQTKLKEIIVKNSAAYNWIDAKKEWDVIVICNRDEQSCVCHQHIKENCDIRNRITNSELTVANVCVKHFKEVNLSDHCEYGTVEGGFNQENKFFDSNRFFC